MKHPDGRATGGEPCVKCDDPVPPNAHWKHRDRHVCSQRCNFNFNRQFNRLVRKSREGKDAVWRGTALTAPPPSVLNPRVSGPRHFASLTDVNEGDVPFEWEGYCPLPGDTVERFGISTTYDVIPADPNIPEGYMFHGNLYIATAPSGHIDVWRANKRGEIARLHWGSVTPEGEMFDGEFSWNDTTLRWSFELISDVTDEGFEYRWEAPVAIPGEVDHRQTYWSSAYRANSERKRRTSASAARHERRMRMDKANSEKFDPMEIYERNGWVCMLCREPVDKSLKWPHELSASLDHTLPLVAGGLHTRDNCQLAHLICNVRKGARVGAESVDEAARPNSGVPSADLGQRKARPTE